MTRSAAVVVLATVTLIGAAEPASGVRAADGPTCNGFAATLAGTDGDDVLVGTDQPDVIVGLGGTDTIRGLRGDDTICAGTTRTRAPWRQGSLAKTWSSVDGETTGSAVAQERTGYSSRRAKTCYSGTATARTPLR